MKKIIPVSILFLIFTAFIYLNAQWAKTFGGSHYERAYSIQQTSDGGYIVAGYTMSFGAGDADVWLLKLSSTGTIEEEWAFGGSHQDVAQFILETDNGGFIVVGNTLSFGAGYMDCWILKFSSEGDIEWQKTYGGSSWDNIYSIQQTSDGGFIAAGETSSFGDEFYDAWVLKLFSNGDIEWQKTYGGSSPDYVYSIQQTSDGGFIAAGQTSSFGAGSSDAWVLKLFSNGDIEWQKTYGGTEYEAGLMSSSIQKTVDGGYILATSTRSFDGGDMDCWLLKLSPVGDIAWQRAYGGISDDDVHSIQQTSDGGFIVAGQTSSFGAGNDDCSILKLSSEGDIEWQKTYGGTADDNAYSIQQTNDGGYIVAGFTGSFSDVLREALILRLNSDGDVIPNCTFLGSSNATITTTFVSAEDTDITPEDTFITPEETDCDVEYTNAETYQVCPGFTLSIIVTTGGTTNPSPGRHNYESGEVATVRAIADSRFQFSGWSGDATGTTNPITITMDSDKSIAASFKLNSTNDGERKDGCFIATAAYGSPLHPYVNILWDFRDKYLMPSQFGRKLVELYYRYSPIVANFLVKHKPLKVAVRINLLPMIAFSYSMVHYGPMATAIMLAFVLALPIFFIWFYPGKLRILELKFENRKK
jgi:uncharacterized delta-60 repeat protein